jgi:hypothetical protein
MTVRISSTVLVSQASAIIRARSAPAAPLWLPPRIDGVAVDAHELYAFDATTVQTRVLHQR